MLSWDVDPVGRSGAGAAAGPRTVAIEHAAESVTGRFEEHHAFRCRTLPDTVDYLSVQIDKLTARITTRLAELSTTQDDDGPGQGTLIPTTDVERLDEIPGTGPNTAQVILAEIGLDMSVFPAAGHLVSWAKLSPRTIQSGGKNASGPTGKGNPWLRGVLSEAAISAARTDTFLGARYRELGPDLHARNLDPAPETRDLVRQLKALGHDVTLTPATT
jgi:transposase